MSVPLELTTVTSMLSVTTLREVSFAPVTLATLEMGPMEAVVVSFNLCTCVIPILLPSVLVMTDVDECVAGMDNCDANATCSNTVGSFTCSCNPGFSGSGVNCTSEFTAAACKH